MLDSELAAREANDLERLAEQMIARRMRRAEFFTAQFFGEHCWDLLLLLFARKVAVSIDDAGQALSLSPTTVSVMAQLLETYQLAEQGEQQIHWGSVEARLTPAGDARVREYLRAVVSDGLLAAV